MLLSRIMGVVNITPDSFSDGGLAFTPEDALSRCEQLAQDGADILDLGAESTRPNATPLNHAEEWARLEPVLLGLQLKHWRKNLQISIDTRHAETAENALRLGVDIINDVSGLTQPAMCAVLAANTCPVIVMHSLSIPANKQDLLPDDTDMAEYMRGWQAKVTKHASAKGISSERLMFDPGLGFGKTAAQSLWLLTHINEYAETPKNWLIGHSKKSLFSIISQCNSINRSNLTLCASAFLYAQGVGCVRVHDVAEHKALRDALA